MAVFRRSALVPLVTSALALVAAKDAKPQRAEPDPFAHEKPAPALPHPEPLGSVTGFTAAQVDAFRNALAREEAERFVASSRELLKSPLATTARQIAKILADHRKTIEAKDLSEETDEVEPLFSYTIPNDPMLQLGTGKTRDGDVTSLPRLVSGGLAFRPRPPEPKPAAGEGDGESVMGNNWYLPEPTQICTHSLAYSLNVSGGPMFSFEHMPPPIDLGADLLYTLLDLESYPNPILAGSAQRELQEETLKAEEAAAAAAGKKPASGDLEEIVGDVGAPPYPRDEADDARAAYFKSLDEKESTIEALVQALKSAYDTAQMTKLYREISSLASHRSDLRKACVQNGHTWADVKRLNPDVINLMSCFTAEKRQVGVGARLVTEGGALPVALSIFHEDPATQLGVELRVSLYEPEAELTAYRGEDYFGPSLRYDEVGAAVALDFKVPDAQRGKLGEYDVFEWHPDGKVKLVGHRKSGIPVGKERSYYASGPLAGQVIYDDKGQLVSYKEWFENHRPAEVTAFKDGRMHGVRRWWHQNGEQAGEIAYDRGIPEGPMSMWYETGAKGVAVTFRRGELDGDVRWWYDDGGPIYEGKFAKDKQVGVHKLYVSTGQVVSERTYSDGGEASGTWIAYDQNGKPSREVPFKKGAKDGKSVVRYPDGGVAIEMTWKDGELEGPVRSFFEDGQLAATCVYEKDVLTTFTRHHKTGEPALEGKVLDPEKGLATFTTMRPDGSTMLDCSVNDFAIEKCKIFDERSNEIRLPDYKTLSKNTVGMRPLPPLVKTAAGKIERKPEDKKAKDPPAQPWAPEKCGGYDTHWNYDALINGEGNEIQVSFETKDKCSDKALATALYCPILIEGGKVEAPACIANGGPHARGMLGEMIADEIEESGPPDVEGTVETQSKEPTAPAH